MNLADSKNHLFQIVIGLLFLCSLFHLALQTSSRLFLEMDSDERGRIWLQQWFHHVFVAMVLLSTGRIHPVLWTDPDNVTGCDQAWVAA